MGRLDLTRRLKVRLPKLRRKHLVFSPVIIALGSSIFLYFKLAHIPGPTTDQLKEHLKSHTLSVGHDTVDGLEQIYFIYDSQRFYITEGNANRSQPVTSGEYIAWVETPEQQNTSLVVLYNALNKVATRLTYYGNAHNPAIDGSSVVWEDYTSPHPAIYYFDGVKTMKISGHHPTARPKVKGKQIIYAQDVGQNQWQTVLYNSTTGKSEVVVTGKQPAAGFPAFVGDKIVGNQP